MNDIERIDSAHDMAVALAREPRFGGRTVAPWTVLQHLVSWGAVIDDPVLRIAWLAHEGDEAYTGDIRWGHKTDDQEAYAEALRRKLYSEVFLLPYPDDSTLEKVHEWDYQMAEAEADIFCHPDIRRRIREKNAELDIPASKACLDIVWEYRDLTPREAIDLFDELWEETRQEPRVRAMERRA